MTVKWYSDKVLVIETNTLEKTKSFLEKFGLFFNEEKHGNGPLHYSCQRDDLVLEIYPKKTSFKIEFGEDLTLDQLHDFTVYFIEGLIARDPELGKTVLDNLTRELCELKTVDESLRSRLGNLYERL